MTTSDLDLAALAVAHNQRDAAAGLIPRYLENEQVLLLVARALAPLLEREVSADDAAA